MNYLIDTHILIWYAEGNPQLSTHTISEIRKPSNRIYISHATFWEMTIKLTLGKLKFSTPIAQFNELITQYNFHILSIDFEHYNVLETLSLHHNDPFDRMLIAQAIAEDMTLITQDTKFASYESPLYP